MKKQPYNNKNLECLDLMLQKGFINHNQLKAGIYYRVLYGSFIGDKRLKAHDISRLQGKNIEHQDIEDRLILIAKYKDICAILGKYHLTSLIIDICIFNTPPKAHQIQDAIYGLELITKYFTEHGAIPFPGYNNTRREERSLQIAGERPSNDVGLYPGIGIR